MLTRKLVLPGSGLVVLVAVLWTARWPNPYLEHVRLIPPPHPYPTEGVVWVLGLAALEIVLLSVVLRPSSYSRSWGRALVALGIAGGFLFLGSLSAMHSPPYWFFYCWWLILLVLGVLILFICSLSSWLWRRYVHSFPSVGE